MIFSIFILVLSHCDHYLTLIHLSLPSFTILLASHVAAHRYIILPYLCFIIKVIYAIHMIINNPFPFLIDIRLSVKAMVCFQFS